MGPENPFKTEQAKAHKNTLSGFVEPTHVSAFQFELQRRTFTSYGMLRATVFRTDVVYKNISINRVFVVNLSALSGLLNCTKYHRYYRY